jgi:glycosyltransferase involved in cell wall biosynthesis
MFRDRKVVVVLPAYNAALTLEKTHAEIPFDIVDEVVLVDDHSSDNTSDLAKKIGIRHVIRHEKNKGYGGNQKSCYAKALELNADVVVMLHPDYQYTPLLIHSMVAIISNDLYPVVFGSREGLGEAVGGVLISWHLEGMDELLSSFSRTKCSRMSMCLALPLTTSFLLAWIVA